MANATFLHIPFVFHQQFGDVPLKLDRWAV